MSFSLGNKYKPNTYISWRDMIQYDPQECSKAWLAMPTSSRAAYQAQAAADEQQGNGGLQQSDYPLSVHAYFRWGFGVRNASINRRLFSSIEC